MKYNHSVVRFYDDPINFFVNDVENLVGLRSIVNGIGVNWSAQYKKVKFRFDRFIKKTSIGCGRRPLRKLLCLDTSRIESFLGLINEDKYKGFKRERILLYKNEFPGFIMDSLRSTEEIEIENWYTKNTEGLQRLIFDSVIKLGNENAIKQLAESINPIINSHFFDSKLPFIEKEHCPETRKAFKIMIENISIKIANTCNPIFDMAEKTSERHKEVKRYKSESLASQILEISEQVREAPDKKEAIKLSLQLDRISKSIR